ncbi:MAG: acyltransferase, partial [Rhodospirillaceae bacterium]|nr:acyltransferase [Rhodospirillaceae bacterium]
MPREIRPLTSLRGIAALLVVVFHFRLVVGPSIDIDAGTAFFASGYLWVDFFFLLSGFVIAYAYARDFQPGSLASYGRFLWRRLARIYPLHVFVVLALIPMEAAKYAIGWYDRPPFAPGSTAGELAAGLALVHSWGLYDHLTWNWPSWSISAEWAAYIAFPALLPLLYRVRVEIAPAAIPLLIGGLFALMKLHGRDDLDMTFDLGVPRGLLSFAIGIAAYRLFEAAPAEARGPLSDWLLAGGLAWIVVALHLGLHPLLVVPGFLAAVLFGALADGPVSRLLGAAPLHFLGEISYSIYLVQYPVQRVWHLVVRRFYGDALDPLAAVLSLIGVLGIVVALSTLTYQWIERPARQYMTRHLPSRPAPRLPVPETAGPGRRCRAGRVDRPDIVESRS